MRLGAVGPTALDGVHALLAAALPFERFSAGLTREKLFEGFRPDDHSTVIAAVERDDLVGVMQSVVRRAAGRAWLGLFAVAAGARRRGVASALLGHVAAEWARAGVHEVGVLGIPGNYFWPGLDPRAPAAVRFLERHGFRRSGEAVNLVADLGAGAPLDTTEDEGRLASLGIAVRRAAADDGPRLDRFFTERFGPDWRHEAERARRLSPPGLHVAVADDRVLGFAAHSAMNREWGWFGPMGTATAAEGRGIGRVLLRRGLADLREAGHPTAVIPWVGPIAFFTRHVSCRVDRVFWQYRKPL